MALNRQFPLGVRVRITEVRDRWGVPMYRWLWGKHGVVIGEVDHFVRVHLETDEVLSFRATELVIPLPLFDVD